MSMHDNVTYLNASNDNVPYLNASPVVNLSDTQRWLEIVKLDIVALKERIKSLEHTIAKVGDHGKP